MTNSINDKVILVTGANRGIGKAIVEAFIAAGAAKIYAAVRNIASVESLQQQYGNKIVPLYLDLADPQSIASAAERARDVEIVINNAGTFRGGELLATEAIESLAFQMDVNVFGLINMAQAFAPILQANGGGVFAQLNSVVSIKAFAGFAAYSASKAAAYSITQSLRETLKEQGTRVLSVHPGPIATDMGDAAGLTAIAEPPSLVADAIIATINSDEFHVFPDTMAKQIGGAYQSYAQNIVEANISEG